MGGGDDRRLSYIAALAWQLPRDSRTWTAIDPLGANDTCDVLLREMEHDIRMLHWSMTKDAEHSSNVPEPIPLPGETDAARRVGEDADRAAVELASRFGLDLGGSLG